MDVSSVAGNPHGTHAERCHSERLMVFKIISNKKVDWFGIHLVYISQVNCLPTRFHKIVTTFASPRVRPTPIDHHGDGGQDEEWTLFECCSRRGYDHPLVAFRQK